MDHFADPDLDYPRTSSFGSELGGAVQMFSFVNIAWHEHCAVTLRERFWEAVCVWVVC
jgi:hypothetical protein